MFSEPRAPQTPSPLRPPVSATSKWHDRPNDSSVDLHQTGAEPAEDPPVSDTPDRLSSAFGTPLSGTERAKNEKDVSIPAADDTGHSIAGYGTSKKEAATTEADSSIAFAGHSDVRTYGE